YLMVEQKIHISEIHLITTTLGKERAEQHLYKNGQGPFYQFCSDYEFSATEISNHFHLIRDARGEVLKDIRTPEDNRAAADYFLRVVRELTMPADTRIFATIAGGRKTMSAYLHFGMQLLGRDQDTLYHVLVQPESIESNPDFFYPLKDTETMKFNDSRGNSFTVPVSEIHIDMAEIPFVRLSRILKEGLVDAITQFSELVAITQAELDKAQFEPQVEVDLPAKMIKVKDRESEYAIRLRPREITLYGYLCRNRQLHNLKKKSIKVTKGLFKIYQTEYAIVNVNEGSFNNEALQQLKSRINRKIRKQISHPVLRDFLMVHSDEDYHGPT
ncbi:MAG: TIGR02584 family CRISPR-associated protein, partial [Phycisphaerae bacterium]|nr:TIGR02584 family CRISPR-associated protein [Phycisphaerae bacterium]